MKENEFFIDASTTDTSRNTSLKEFSDIGTKNASCFVVNDEQGGQSKVRDQQTTRTVYGR